VSEPVFRQARRRASGRPSIPVPVVVADITGPDGTYREVVVRWCESPYDADNTAFVLSACNLDALRCALNQDAEGIAGEAARLRSDLEQLEHMAVIALAAEADEDGLVALRDAIRKTLRYKPEVTDE